MRPYYSRLNDSVCFELSPDGGQAPLRVLVHRDVLSALYGSQRSEHDVLLAFHRHRDEIEQAASGRIAQGAAAPLRLYVPDFHQPAPPRPSLPDVSNDPSGERSSKN